VRLRETERSGLRSAKGLIVYLLAFYAIWGVRATVFFPIDQGIPSEELRQLYAQTLRILIWVVPVFWYLRSVDRVDPLWYLKLSTPVRRGQLVPAMALAAGYLALGLLFNDLISGGKVALDTPVTLRKWLQMIVFLPIAPIAEEILYRGFVLRKLEERYRFRMANLITAVLFAAIHWPNWVCVSGFHARLILMTATIVIFGCFLGYLVKKTDSLWPAIATHTVNNLLFAVIHFG
jgi:membrane protease YdiL (CAAX protease family)